MHALSHSSALYQAEPHSSLCLAQACSSLLKRPQVAGSPQVNLLPYTKLASARSSWALMSGPLVSSLHPPHRHPAMKTWQCHCTSMHRRSSHQLHSQDPRDLSHWPCLTSPCRPPTIICFEFYYEFWIVLSSHLYRQAFPDHLSTTANHTPPRHALDFFSKTVIFTWNHTICLFIVYILYQDVSSQRLRTLFCPAQRPRNRVPQNWAGHNVGFHWNV